ncbi:MAG: protein kinase [Chloroflexota bacterium]
MSVSNASSQTPTTKSDAAVAKSPSAETRELTNYRLGERLEQEELATVYRATHQTLDRPVQLHILRRTDWVSSSRFQLAARLSARLNHPNVLPVIDAGHDDRYGAYVVTPHIEGRTLEEVLANGPLEATLALRIVTQIGSALDYLHEQKVVHRDMRPGNILLTPQGVAYLNNLSLAAAPDTPDFSSIEDGDYLTPYSAPEQTFVDKDASPTQDLYSLGALLYHMLGGNLPPALGEKLKSLGERDTALASADRVVQKLMMKEANQRFQNSGQAVAALRQALRAQIDDSTDDMEESRWETMAEWLENPLETVLSTLLEQEFLTKSRARADQMHRTGMLKRQLDRWSRQSFLRKPGLGEVIQPDQITSYNVYFYELKAHYETRTPPKKRTEVHKGGALTPAVQTPELWSVKVPELEAFVDAPAKEIVIPGSQKVIACTECNGTTQTVCKTCSGKGSIERVRRVKASDGTTRNEKMQENCPACRGYGKVPCSRCEATGQMREEQAFTWSRHGRAYFNEDDITGLSKPTLEEQLQQVYQSRIDPYESRWHQIAPLHELIEEAIKGGGDNTRLITAELTIRGVPVTEVDYQHSNAPHSLTIIGFKDEIRGDWTVIDISKLIPYAVIAVLMLILLIVIIF